MADIQPIGWFFVLGDATKDACRSLMSSHRHILVKPFMHGMPSKEETLDEKRLWRRSGSGRIVKHSLTPPAHWLDLAVPTSPHSTLTSIMLLRAFRFTVSRYSSSVMKSVRC